MKNMDYLDEIKVQLKRMSEIEKDEWIISQAKTASENMQKDFLMTLTGEKKIMNIPTLEEIDDFCIKVKNCEIYFEYETHYNEFGEDGNYIDDWSIWYNDPFAISNMIDRIFTGCHRLMLLEEYQYVFNILSKLFELDFFVEISEDSEDGPADEFISLSNINEEGMLSNDLSGIGKIWIESFIYLTEGQDIEKSAHKLIIMLEHSVCKKLKPRMLIDYGVSQQVFSHMVIILEEEISKLEYLLKTKSLENFYTLEKYNLQVMLNRKKEILVDIRLKCLITDFLDFSEDNFNLSSGWEDINEIVNWLKFEIIDDQPDIDTIFEICEDIMNLSSIEQESWSLRHRIIKDIVENDFYDIFGCSDIMESVADKMCTNSSEYLAYADILNSTYDLKEKAAYLYYQYGQEDKYISYLENHLGKRCKEYIALITYYKDHNQEEKARDIANLGLKNCKDDLTDIFIFLLLDAKKYDDKEQFDKLYASAKRRKHVNLEKVNNEL